MATILGSTNSSLWTFKLEVSEGTYSIANNTSPVTVKAYIGRSSNSGSYMYGADIDITIGCTGVSPKTVNYRNTGRVDIAANGWLLVGTVTFSAVPHNDDGGKEVKVTGEFSNPGVSPSSGSASGWVTLATIPRKATLGMWPASFTDEENPTIRYSNPAGSAVTSLQACIALNKTDIAVPYKNLLPNGTEYTFQLTDAERSALQKATLNGSTSREVLFFVKTVLGSEEYFDYQPTTLIIVDCKPTLSPVIKDTNEVTKALTGSDQTIVRHASVVSVSTGATAMKHASFVSQAIICGADTFYGASKTIENPQSGVFEIVAKDNRGQTVESGKILKSFVEYINLTCSQSVRISLDTVDETSSIANLTISGNYFDGNFGASDNSLSLWYRYKVNDEKAWSTLEQDGWRAVDETVSKANGTYTVTIPVAGLDYSKQYIFQSMAEDKLGNVQTTEYIIKTQPAFDWGDSDFNFNVPVTMQKDFTVKGNQYIYGTHAGNVMGYVAMAKIEITSAYANAPVMLEFSHRSSTAPMRVHLRFYNLNGLNPSLHMIVYEGDNHGAFLVNDAQIANDNDELGPVWTLYIGKQYANDWITLQRWTAPTFMNGRITITPGPGTVVESVPAPYWRATPFVPKNILDSFMPVGFVLTLYSHADPNTMYPGTTWTRITNAFLWACDANGEIGQTGGEKTHTLTVNELPKHSHNVSVASMTSGSLSAQNKIRYSNAATDFNGSIASETAGAGAAHNNMPPYIQVSVWRRTA